MPKKLRALLVLLAVMATTTACGNNEDAAEHETHTSASGDKFNDADVQFATDMIQHHAQALAMVDLTMGRQLDPGVDQLAEDIRTAQGREIEHMTDWLADWNQPIPETVRDHANAHEEGREGMAADVPGMMSGEEMAELEATKGSEFQEMWLHMMIDHHEGAIEMAQSEQADGEFRPALQLAKNIESAQQDGISRMESLL